MAITPKTLVLLDITETIARIGSSPKNATNSLRDTQNGAIRMAHILGAISAKEAEIAKNYINRAAAWRQVNNFPHMEKWLEEYKSAQREFNEVWL